MTCQHYFIYETANGKKSKGVCKYCGAERKDANSIEAVLKVSGRAANWNNRHYPVAILERQAHINKVYEGK